MTGVLDPLLAPRNGFDEVYDSTFNRYWDWGDPGYPGYMPNRANARDLLINFSAPIRETFTFTDMEAPITLATAPMDLTTRTSGRVKFPPR